MMMLEGEGEEVLRKNGKKGGWGLASLEVRPRDVTAMDL
jgi:hypothetical protein